MVALIAVFLGALLILVADHVTVHEYSIAPGNATSVFALLKVPVAQNQHRSGQILYTDVHLTTVNLLTTWIDRLRPHVALVGQGTVLPADTSPSQLATQGYVEMHLSQIAAIAAALNHLGQTAALSSEGALVAAVTASGPSAHSLRIGEVIRTLDGTTVSSACDVEKGLAALAPGASAVLSVERSHLDAHATLVPGPLVSVTIRLGARPAMQRSSSGCPLAVGAQPGFLGVALDDDVVVSTPFAIHVDTTDIGGPSAGLAMALGLVDELSSGRLAAHRVVAATGTIAPTGVVGAVGGVEQKAVAVAASGASVFFVPEGQVSTARAGASGDLRIVAVATLDQAIAWLRTHR